MNMIEEIKNNEAENSNGFRMIICEENDDFYLSLGGSRTIRVKGKIHIFRQNEPIDFDLLK